MRDHGIHLLRFVRELSLSPGERGAARAERRAEREMRRERDSQHTADRRAARLAAEARRQQNQWPGY